jgi:uncharacterized protein YbcI
MRKRKTELEQEISDVFCRFLREQLGEHATSVQTFLSENMLTVRALDCLAPAEQQCARNQQHWKLIQETKMLEFNKVKPVLLKTLAQVTSCEVVKISSLFEQDGVRLEVVTLSDNLERKLLQLKE